MVIDLPKEPLSADERQLLADASALFKHEIGEKSSDFARVQWNRRTDDRGRTLYHLSISDPWAEEVGTDFAKDELENQLHLRYRLYRLWGDLLQRRSDRQHERVMTLSRELGFADEGQ